MKRLINTGILSLMVVLAMAQPIDSLKKANEYYAANEITKAISTYENIVSQGYGSASLYFNLGNAYYKNNEIVKALLNYERAQLYSPNDEDIQFNLDLVNQFVVDKIEPLPRPFFMKWRESIINIMNSDGWATVSLISFILLLVFAAIYVFARSTGIKKLSFSIAIILLLGSLLSFGYARNQKSKLTNRNNAIIFTPSVTAKASPSDSGIDLFVIHEGLKVEIVNERNNWFEIKLKDGTKGWVQKFVLEII